MPKTLKRPTQLQARRLLAEALDASGLTQEQFAWDVLLTHVRTLQRWRRGISPIPAPVLDWCARQSHRKSK